MFTESQYINVTYHVPDQFRIPLTSSGRSRTAWKSPSLRKPVPTIMTHVTQGTVPAWSLNSESGADIPEYPQSTTYMSWIFRPGLCAKVLPPMIKPKTKKLTATVAVNHAENSTRSC